MAALHPKPDTLQQSFASTYSLGLSSNRSKVNGTTPLQARLDLYSAYSISDDAKSKAKQLSAEAVREFEAASQKAQSTTGKIELYSSKYYAACTFGGLMACVSRLPWCQLNVT